MNNKLIQLAFAAILAVLVSACAATPGPQEAEQEAGKAHAFEPWDGDGMEIPLNGKDLEAFETSLARVEAHSSAASYTTLLNAIEYLLVYDLGAERDRAKLAARLDGLTPKQVIDKVGWRKPASRR